jgi:hypothetical protein
VSNAAWCHRRSINPDYYTRSPLQRLVESEASIARIVPTRKARTTRPRIGLNSGGPSAMLS